MIINLGGMNADALNTLEQNQKRFMSQKRHMMKSKKKLNEPPDPKTIESLRKLLERRTPWDE